MARPLTKQECQHKVLDMLVEIADSDRATENATRYRFLFKELGKMSRNGLISLLCELIHLRSVTLPISGVECVKSNYRTTV